MDDESKPKVATCYPSQCQLRYFGPPQVCNCVSSRVSSKGKTHKDTRKMWYWYSFSLRKLGTTIKNVTKMHFISDTDQYPRKKSMWTSETYFYLAPPVQCQNKVCMCSAMPKQEHEIMKLNQWSIAIILCHDS